MTDLTTEEKILKASLKEFSDFGLEGARMDRIAKKAKVNKAMIYYHYKGKEALYEKILSGVYGRIYQIIDSIPLEGKSSGEKITSLISGYFEFVSTIEKEYIRLMIRELATGGKYFRKLAIPNLVMPVLNLAGSILEEGNKNDIFVDLDPVYSFIQIVGSIVFSRFIRNAVEGTDIEKMIFREDFLEKYKSNLLTIINNGIYRKENV